MASGGMQWQLPTEKLKNQANEMMEEIDELEKIIEKKDARISELEAKVEELDERDAKLTALENGGVDNWEGYEPSMEEA